MYTEAMAIKEKDIIENPKYNKLNKTKQDDSNISTPKIANSKNDYSKDAISGYDDNQKDANNSSSLNSSVNISQMNKTARIQHNMSIFQRNFAKVAPIFRQILSLLVKEGEDGSTNTSRSYNTKGNLKLGNFLCSVHNFWLNTTIYRAK